METLWGASPELANVRCRRLTPPPRAPTAATARHCSRPPPSRGAPLTPATLLSRALHTARPALAALLPP
eukprot:3472865-Prymnesium_polylepis.1